MGESIIRITTINIPDQYLDCLETLVNLGFYPSRSEAVREALKHFLSREAEMNADFQPDQFRDLKEHQLRSLLR
jgi:Arc/MetJ-type ribon-helix-helix transcriptional regulator